MALFDIGWSEYLKEVVLSTSAEIEVGARQGVAKQHHSTAPRPTSASLLPCRNGVGSQREQDSRLDGHAQEQPIMNVFNSLP